MGHFFNHCFRIFKIDQFGKKNQQQNILVTQKLNQKLSVST